MLLRKQPSYPLGIAEALDADSHGGHAVERGLQLFQHFGPVPEQLLQGLASHSK
jgi:hypothetical protein